ncbi:unnamed protein product [Heligmosomoides polygyrus]|uniref:Exonuclease domain-containing protein n=1 Tax=Heligmosomoides polygyrus TaxID=6339 RepID=A0A183GJ73_HELPZ|nr:unnamed protein product [Heligmosomoides polygyrus]
MFYTMSFSRTYRRGVGKCVIVGDAENSRSVTPAREEAQDEDHSGYDGADKVEVRGFDDGNCAVNARNGRCQCEILAYACYRNFCQDQSDDNPVFSETSSFPTYDRDIESVLEFQDRKITIVLTLNVDGVRFKKLSGSESWPIYIRLEGLPFKEKNKYENVILAGIMFTRKPPTETLLVELFSGLKHELEVLLREGIPIHTASDTWICTPKLVNGIIDFAMSQPFAGIGHLSIPPVVVEALQTLYGLPRWQHCMGVISACSLEKDPVEA